MLEILKLAKQLITLIRTNGDWKEIAKLVAQLILLIIELLPTENLMASTADEMSVEDALTMIDSAEVGETELMSISPALLEAISVLIKLALSHIGWL